MNLPKDFEGYFRERWRDEDVEALVKGLDAEPSVSIRKNPACLSSDAVPKGADGRVPWCPEGFYLSERPAFTADPLLHAGAYYVQEASSMFLAYVLRNILHASSFTFHSQTVLDLCAAPGGKSTLLRSLLPDDCLLVANEPVRARCQVLAENLSKWGHPNVLVTQAYARELAKAYSFDLILADVPCSGEGMMRKEAEAVAQWSPAFVAECATLQRSIIEDIWPALRPGGLLIYSTCTFNPEEDEENVEWIVRELGAEMIPVPVDPAWGIRGEMRRELKVESLKFKVLEGSSEQARAESLKLKDESLKFFASEASQGAEWKVQKFFHFLPGQVRGEGFFCAVLRKDGEAETWKEKKQKGRDRLTTLPTDLLDSPEAPRVELSLEEAVRYLQREAIVLPPDSPRGIVQVCFQGQRLGLAKNLGSRANNLYPKEWRIRSGYTIGQTLFPQ